MNEENENNQYDYYKQNLKYEEDLNNIFKDLTGLYYDHKTKKLIKHPDFKEKYCKDIVNKLMGYTIKSLTNITRFSKNKKETITYKSTDSKANLWQIFHIGVLHECVKKPHCVRTKSGAEMETDVSSLAKVIDDGYRRSMEGITLSLTLKNHQVSETISHEKMKGKKTSLIQKMMTGRTEEDQEEI